LAVVGGEKQEALMNGETWLEEVRALFGRYKEMCEKAAAQVSDEDFFAVLGAGENSIAVLMKHLGGNHRSRWRDFLTTDGEKADRHRDQEFVVEGETRASIMALWNEGWDLLFANLEPLSESDLERTITIRGEPHSVPQAIQRSLTHSAYHTGQVVQLARHHAGADWQTLSVAPGRSKEHNAAMRAKFGDWRSS